MDDSTRAPATAGRRRTTAGSTVSLPQAVSQSPRMMKGSRPLDAQGIVHYRLSRVSGLVEQADPVVAGSDQAPRQRQWEGTQRVGRDSVPAPHAPTALAEDLDPVSLGTTGVRGVKDDGEETKIAGNGGARLRTAGAARRAGVEIDHRRVRLRRAEGLDRAAQRDDPGREPHRGDEQRGGERHEPARLRGGLGRAAERNHRRQGLLLDFSLDPPPQTLLVRGGEGAGAEGGIGQAVEVDEQGGALPAGQQVILEPLRLAFRQLAGVIGRERLRLRVVHAPSSKERIELSKYGPSSS